MSSPVEEGGLRLFFALWPDEAVRLELVRISRQLSVPPGAKRVVPDNLHLTMAFIGTQGPEVQACLEEQVRRQAVAEALRGVIDVVAS